ncbi:hypothetical protein AMYX_13500 [Anaeromyxobacter diazotrophicus]|uniref:Uncharacterized protein n=1 Tax=Anaeromyxobacter diazotrophicus TaxID=2590199 RepID=A0A7I9VKG0_9BACT|nr:hypothetical protein AMYX_13500 [Anaeromyxobacter diazotrophicus]
MRLVYCLGYGEPELCFAPPKRNAGTRQYWDIFGALAYGSVDAVQPRRSRARNRDGLRDRIHWKIDTLARLQERGIWLLDVSPVALYAPGGGRAVTGSRYRDLVRSAFTQFIGPRLSRFHKLNQVWVIGYDLARHLEPVAAKWLARDHVIIQPQGERACPGRLRTDLSRMVRAAQRHAR